LHSRAMRVPVSPLLAVIEGSARNAAVGYELRAADVNGDGLADVAIGTLASTEAGIFFGGKLRNEVKFGAQPGVSIRESQGHGLKLMGSADINGDGLHDLIWADSDGTTEFAGTDRVLVLFGRRQWSPRLNLPEGADLTLSFTVSYNASPHRTATSRSTDLNGDGIDDLILAAADFCPPDRASAGAIFIFWGRRQWPAKLDIPAQANVTIWGAVKGETLAEAAVGDLNGDGRNDLALGASDSSLWGLRQSRGRVYIFHGRARWPRVVDAAKDYDVRIEGADPEDRFSQPEIGDLNGDGIADVTVGAFGKDSVYVFFGRQLWPRQLTQPQADWKVTRPERTRGLGINVAVGNLNGDAVDDLVVCDVTREELLAFYGGPARRGVTFTKSTEFVLRPPAPTKNLCSRRMAVADLDGNDSPEILAGVPDMTAGGEPNAGKVYLFSPFQSVQIDIRPGGYPNLVWPGSFRTLVVAVAPQEYFNPSAIDPATVRLAGVAPFQSQFCPSGPPGSLCFYFESKDMKLKKSDRKAILVARTRDGVPLFGADSVLVAEEKDSKPK
ncbi:MAG TPA: VCBS repeat-containing protein, partial [Candidatus Nitrosotenuis sp.]|nr:VCBS repeat-containing protein [Candidatus Nitrosotenuis sp.]